MKTCMMAVCLVFVCMTVRAEQADRPERPRRGNAGRIAAEQQPADNTDVRAASLDEGEASLSPAPPPPPPPPQEDRRGRPVGPGNVRPGDEGPEGPAERMRSGREEERGPEARDQIRGAMRWLKQNHPEAFEKLNRLREENPQKFRAEMREWLKKYAQENNPEQYQRFKEMREHEQKMHALARQYRAEDEPEKKKELKEQIRAALTEEFEHRQEIRGKELEQLETRLNEYRKTLKQREKNKEQLIDIEVKRLTQGPQSVEW